MSGLREQQIADFNTMKQRAEAAEADAEQAIKYQEHYRGKWKSAEAEVARLREALERYGGHDITCPFTTGCTCGFRQALAQEQADG